MGPAGLRVVSLFTRRRPNQPVASTLGRPHSFIAGLSAVITSASRSAGESVLPSVALPRRRGVMRRLGALFVMVGAGIFLAPALAAAQASISGTVKDASGAVLPGVTVEAASPALIEKVRTVVTDGAGIYSIVDLRPGTYAVTFTLPGFSTVRREGIELSGAFNAEVNADLRVGALSETITVSGASPVVDVKNTLSQTVLTKEQIEVLPGGRTIKGRAALIPGVIVPGANTGVVSHGSD